MQDPRTKPSPPTQLLMPLDSTRLRGMSPLERKQAVTRLAILLTEAAEAVEVEPRDDGR
jgi:hypothetical protein